MGINENLILVVDDEKNIRELVKYNLESRGYKVTEAANGQEALEKVENETPALIILDLMLPVIDGFEVCRLLREKPATKKVPIIMLTARGEEVDKVVGLELGADDYVTKPFSPRELVARVKAVMRRASDTEEANDIITCGGLSIDIEKHEVLLHGKRVDLTPKEFELLRLLASNPSRVFTRDYLLENVWGYDYPGDTRTVDVHIRHLRQKIEEDDTKPKYIETIRGVGYRFCNRG